MHLNTSRFFVVVVRDAPAMAFIMVAPRKANCTTTTTPTQTLNTEHDLALLHMSIYIAERWHRAHGLCMCWAGEAPIFNELQPTQTVVEVLWKLHGSNDVPHDGLTTVYDSSTIVPRRFVGTGFSPSACGGNRHIYGS